MAATSQLNFGTNIFPSDDAIETFYDEVWLHHDLETAEECAERVRAWRAHNPHDNCVDFNAILGMVLTHNSREDFADNILAQISNSNG